MSPRLGDLFLTSQSDEQLVSLARAGHERAFAVIVERYRPELLAFARRLSSDGRGEDILQQAFLSAFAALRSGAEVRHLRGWLYRIARNAAAPSPAPVCVPLDDMTAGGLAVEDVVQQRALAMSALTEMGRLPKRQRQAIVGTALDGRPRAEIAGAMGLSEGAVRQLVHRARAQLRTVVTAVIPWPLVRWLAGAGTGGAAGTGSAADVAAGVGAGAGAASSAGVALKLGVVLVSGAIATGVAAVDIHGGAPRAHRAAPRAGAAHAAHAAHPRATRPRAPVVAAPVAVVDGRGSERSRGGHGSGEAERHRQGGRSGGGGGGGTSDGGGSRSGGGSGMGRGSDDGGGSDGGGGGASGGQGPGAGGGSAGGHGSGGGGASGGGPGSGGGGASGGGPGSGGSGRADGGSGTEGGGGPGGGVADDSDH